MHTIPTVPFLRFCTKWLLISLLFFLLLASISLLALPIWADIILSLLIMLLLRFNAWSMITAIISILVMCLGLSFYPLPKDAPVYYREHEEYTRGDAYAKNVSVIIDQPYGDLYAIDAGVNPDKRERMKEPRVVEFITDQYGYRNNLFSIEEADVILGGDSYVVGTGNSQDDIPANILSRLTGLKIASIAHPGYAASYMPRIKRLLDKIRDDAKIYLFFCEGGDIGVRVDSPKSQVGDLINRYLHYEYQKDLLLKAIYPQESVFFRKVRAQSHILNRRILGLNNVEYFNINGDIVGELKDRVAKHTPYQVDVYIIKDSEMLKRLNGIFFVPNKYRVYAKYVTDDPVPDKVITELKRVYAEVYAEFNIPVYDLTPVLQKRADELIREKKYVYWRDDTHWNRYGIEVAMECVKEVIHNEGRKPVDQLCQ